MMTGFIWLDLREADHTPFDVPLLHAKERRAPQKIQVGGVFSTRL